MNTVPSFVMLLEDFDESGVVQDAKVLEALDSVVELATRPLKEGPERWVGRGLLKTMSTVKTSPTKV